MFKRIKTIWNLSKVVDLEEIPKEKKGNGNAVFLGEGTQDEFVEFQREEEGLKGWYNRLKNL